MRQNAYNSVTVRSGSRRIVTHGTRSPQRKPEDARAFLARSVELGLDPLDRILLTGDGTVTTLLESCLGEQIVTKTTWQSGPAALAKLGTHTGVWWHPDAALLQLAPDEEIIARRATLRGASSGTAFVLAESVLVPDRLPSEVAIALRRDGSSIGRLLNSTATETRREVLDIGRLRAGEASDHLATNPGTSLAWRTYGIAVGGRRALLISEFIVPGRLSSVAVRPSPVSAAEPRYGIAARIHEEVPAPLLGPG
jgi:chorismate-pyruvate lyase